MILENDGTDRRLHYFKLRIPKITETNKSKIYTNSYSDRGKPAL